MLFTILFILLFIVNIYFLIKSIRKKDNNNWIISFSLNISSIFSVILILGYSLYNNSISILDSLGYLVIYLFALFLYIITLITNTIFKLLQIRKNKINNIVIKKIAKKTKKKLILLPLLCVISLSIVFCGIYSAQGALSTLGNKIIHTKYNRVRNNEINKMADFLNKKYKLKLDKKDCIYYREEDYSEHSDVLGNGKIYNIPYIAVFKTDNEEITVTDRKGFISDNKQLKDINTIITKYFQEKTGIEFSYVEFGKSYVGNWYGDDNVINIVLQTKFNKLLSTENVEELLNYILQESDLSIKFYIKNNGNDKNLIYKITKQLSYLKSYSNIDILQVQGYKKELTIKHKKIIFPSKHQNYGNSGDDYDDGYKYGCYYVDSNANEFTFNLTMDLDRGYNSGNGKIINGWKFKLVSTTINSSKKK